MKYIEDYFQGKKNLKLCYRSWLPDGEIKAVILIAHGIAEHCGRYSDMAEYLVPKGYAVFGFDYRGHGKSEGRRCYVEHFSYYLDDLQTCFKLLVSLHPQKKIMLFGHSMGAIVGLADIIHNQNHFSGLILSGVAMKIKPDLPGVIIALLKPLSVFLPGLGLKKINSFVLSRDKRVVESYDNDPLVYRGRITARLAIELVEWVHELKSLLYQIEIPILVVHGSEDRLSYPEGARLVFERVRSKDKTLKLYSGLYHEIINEPEHIQVLSDIEIWLSHLV